MSSGFVTETEAIEARKKRQEEWEKVRNPEDPIEKPEEPYDSRCLYDRLKEQKDKKDLEYEEAHKLKNMIRGLDDDEIGFLDFIDRTKMNAEKIKLLEENKELEEFRNRVATLHEKTHDEKLHAEINGTIKQKQLPKANTKRSQKSILSGVVIKKRKVSDELNDEKDLINNDQTTSKTITSSSSSSSSKDLEIKPKGFINPSALKVIGILPGVGSYKSDSSSDSDDDNFKYDFVGREIKKKKDEEC